jgi:hypothetical protein
MFNRTCARCLIALAMGSAAILATGCADDVGHSKTTTKTTTDTPTQKTTTTETHEKNTTVNPR